MNTGALYPSGEGIENIPLSAFTKPTINSNRVKNLSGGYYIIGNRAYIDMTFQLNVANTGNFEILSYLPVPVGKIPVQIVGILTTDTPSVYAGYSAYIQKTTISGIVRDNSGYLYNGVYNKLGGVFSIFTSESINTNQYMHFTGDYMIQG